MKVRIGIDVGGTFTDAVAIDNETYELVGKAKVPTTHDSEEGVSLGIIQALNKILEDYSIKVEDVMFLAHGTTQATNAFLEGDVVKVGILAVGSGIEGLKAKVDSDIGKIELAPNRFLETSHRYLDVDNFNKESIQSMILELKSNSSEVVVGSEAYSVDNPTREQAIMEEAKTLNLAATGTHEISKLYGLKKRTRTAVINASLLPKMIETANMTEASVKKAGIQSPLMIMRCDGGVMDVNEVRSRPILTMLSGPAAGVAGALMYEKVTDAVFLEVGGTSTDISIIKNGKVVVEYAEVGGHKTYVNSLDVRTVGIAGGSMIRIEDGKLVDVGPRSAHIAALPYAVYSDPEQLKNGKIVSFQPKPGDPDSYIAIEIDGKRFAITLACVSNYLGYVQKEHYAFGNIEAAKIAIETLASHLNQDPVQVAREIMNKAAEKNKKVINQMIKDYKLDPDTLLMIGGGGGAATVVPQLAESMDIKYRIAKNADVISPIGVALAMVREVVERFIQNATEEDILSVRKEAEDAVVRAGAQPGTVEIQVNVDRQKSIVQAIATGATELRTKELGIKLNESELQKQVREAVKGNVVEINTLANTQSLYVMQCRTEEKKIFGLLVKKSYPIRVIDEEGVIRLQKSNAVVEETSAGKLNERLQSVLGTMTIYGDSIEIPDTYVLQGKRIIDCSGVTEPEQVLSLVNVEMKGLSPETKVVMLVSKRGMAT